MMCITKGMYKRYHNLQVLKVSTEHDPLKDLKLGSYLGNSELKKDRENTNLMATVIA